MTRRVSISWFFCRGKIESKKFKDFLDERYTRSSRDTLYRNTTSSCAQEFTVVGRLAKAVM